MGRATLRVLLGTSSLWGGGTAYTVQRVAVHPPYGGGISGYDLALLELTVATSSAPLRRMTPRFDADWGVVDGLLPGWGATVPTGGYPSELHWAGIENIDPQVCRALFGVETVTTLCGGGVDGAACFGDSGGPLLEAREARLRVAGIVSGGGEPCGSRPDVFVRVTAHDAWINSYLNEPPEPDPLVHERRRDSVVRLYFAYFLRPPEAGGLAYWWSSYESGRTLSSISLHSAESSEFRTRYGELGSEGLIRLVYQKVLGRDPDPGAWPTGWRYSAPDGPEAGS